MQPIYLNFSTFYQSVVKTQTSHLQYDSVSLLLYGTLREDNIYEISDRTASYYVTGIHNINKDCLKKIFMLSMEEIINRFKLLEFQNLDYAVEACKKLLSVTTELSATEHNKLLSILDNDEKSENASYMFLASTFLQAIRCKYKCKLKKEEQNYLTSILNEQPTTFTKPEESVLPVISNIEKSNDLQQCQNSIHSFFQNDLSIQIKSFLFPEQLHILESLCEPLEQSYNFLPLDKEDFKTLYRGLQYHDYIYTALLHGNLSYIKELINLLNIEKSQNMIVYVFPSIDICIEDVSEIFTQIEQKAPKVDFVMRGISFTDSDSLECLLLWS